MNDVRRPPQAVAPATSGWGTAPALNAFETLMWRMDRYPHLRSAVVAVAMLDCEPDPSRVHKIHQSVVAAIPRLREKLVDVPLGLPAWVADERFDLNAHLGFTKLSSNASLRKLMDHAAAIAMAPFDHARSPWEAQLVTGIKGGRAAYVLKLHHALSDGIGIVQLLDTLFSRTRDADGMHVGEAPRLPTKAAAKGSMRLLRGQVRRSLHQLPLQVRSGFKGMQRRVMSGARMETIVSDLARYAGSARRAIAPVMAEPSPLLAARNHQWHFETLDLPLAGLKAAAKSCGATLNDAYVAGLLGGFARYHREMGVEVDEIPFGMPISIRAEGAAGGGNHFVPGQLIGPLGEMSPSERMRNIGAQVTRLRQEPALGAPLAIMPLLTWLPDDAVAKIMGSKMAANDLQCSNVPGIREDVFLAGAQVTHLYPFAPLPGVPAMISLVTHGANCCVGMNLDRAAITDTARFKRCMRKSFDELLAGSPSGNARPPPSDTVTRTERKQK